MKWGGRTRNSSLIYLNLPFATFEDWIISLIYKYLISNNSLSYDLYFPVYLSSSAKPTEERYFYLVTSWFRNHNHIKISLLNPEQRKDVLSRTKCSLQCQNLILLNQIEVFSFFASETLIKLLVAY